MRFVEIGLNALLNPLETTQRFERTSDTSRGGRLVPLTPPIYPDGVGIPKTLYRGSYFVGIEIPSNINPAWVLQTLQGYGLAISNIQQEPPGGQRYQFTMTVPRPAMPTPSLPVRLLFLRKIPS